MGTEGGPRAVQEALWQLSILSESEAQVRVSSFQQRWGSLEPEAFTRALAEGDSSDKILAMLVLSNAHEPMAYELLLPLLDSSVLYERWASALGLGRMNDERALGVLCRMLSEELPSTMDEYLDRADLRYEYWRADAAKLIGSLGDRSRVPALRHALEIVVDLLDQERSAARGNLANAFESRSMDPDGREEENPPEVSAFSFELRQDAQTSALIDYEDELIYALGRLEGFGALTRFRVAQELQEIWTVHMIMGHLHGRYSWLEIPQRDPGSPLNANVRLLLRNHFGLDDEEQGQVLSAYMCTKSGKLLIKWQFAERTRGQG